jgi:5,6-dimethylbenzimidazole synthase
MTDGPDFDADFRRQLGDLLAWRRDVRRFLSRPLPEGTLDRLIGLACLAPSVGLSQPWRFVLVESAERRVAVRQNFLASNAEALGDYRGERAKLYATLKLAGLDEAPVHLGVFAERATEQGQGLGRRTMPEMVDYSVVCAIHSLWLAARAEASVSAGFRSSIPRRSPARSKCRRPGRSSPISASAIRRRTRLPRSSSAPAGSIAARWSSS